MSNARSVNESNFEEEVIESTEPTLVDFWAEWCGPCRALAPVLDKLAIEFEGKANIVKVNVDENPGLASKYGIRSIPALLLFKNGQVVEQTLGLQSQSQLATLLTKHA